MEKRSKRRNPEPMLAVADGVLPPSNIELEEAVLGGILSGGPIASVSAILKPEMFFRDAHRIVYSAICDLEKERSAIDLYTVVQALQKRGELAEIGGPAFVVSLTARVGSGSHTEYHAVLVAEMYMLRQLLRVGAQVQQMAAGGSDVGDITAFMEKSIADVYNAVSFGNAVPIPHVLSSALKEAEQRAANFAKGITPGVDPGIPDLTRILCGGWLGGQLIIIASRPGMGKTAMLLHFAKSAAMRRVPVLIFQLEMHAVSLINRMLLSECDIPADRFRRGDITPTEWEKLERAHGKLSTLPISIDDTPGTTIDRIRHICRAEKNKGRCGLVILDYIQLIAPTDKRIIREQQVAEISRGAKLIAKELDVPVIIAAQLSREVERRGSKIPQLSDLRESGTLEQDADVVAFVYRPEYYKNEDQTPMISSINIPGVPYPVPSKGYGEIIVAKQRDGAHGAARFSYNESLTKITGFDYDAHRKGLAEDRPF